MKKMLLFYFIILLFQNIMMTFLQTNGSDEIIKRSEDMKTETTQNEKLENEENKQNQIESNFSMKLKQANVKKKKTNINIQLNYVRKAVERKTTETDKPEIIRVRTFKKKIRSRFLI